jgi:hypothetical protein
MLKKCHRVSEEPVDLYIHMNLIANLLKDLVGGLTDDAFELSTSFVAFTTILNKLDRSIKGRIWVANVVGQGLYIQASQEHAAQTVI